MTQYDDDLDAMFTDLPSVTLAFGAASGQAFEDLSTADVLMGMSKGVVGDVRTLTFRTALFPGLQIGSAVTVDGVAYDVRDRRLPTHYVDGAITEVDLKKSP